MIDRRSSDDTVLAEHPSGRLLAGGRYAVMRVLGGGTQKTVYLVHDRELDRTCALSILRSEAAPSDDDLARLRREARAMAKIGAHPNLVTVHDIGIDEGRPFLVCEHVPGGDLRDELRRAGAPLAVDRAVSVARQLLEALEYAHSRGIVHRDIKPANIWIGEGGTAKLGDFGMAYAAGWSRITTAGTVLGTPSYMAPEQARGEPADESSDLYAVGCVLHEMLSGQPPFAGEDVMGVLYQHVHVPPPPVGPLNAAVPRGLERLVLRLLSKARSDRPASAAAALAELGRAATDDAPPSPQGGDEGPLVGRAVELAALRDALGAALAGRGSLVCLVGEGGIGKSRLARAVARGASDRGMRVLIGACAEAEGATPYLPWGEALRPVIQRPESSLRGAALTHASALERLLPARGEGSAPILAPTGADRYATFQSVVAALVAVAAPAGLLLVLEDLHWADKPSLLLLAHVARQLSGARILILATYRDTDIDRKHPLAEALADLRRERLFERVVLRGLPDDDARAMVATLGGVSDSLLEGIVRETEGNPFFIQELLRHVAEAGTATIAEVGLPEGIREVIGRRLSRLSAECNKMLGLASVVGNAFPWATVVVASGTDEDVLLDLLDEALEAHVIHESRIEAGRYEFAHALIRQTLREELSAPRRARLHRQIAEAMERVHGADLEPHRAEIAQHFIRAGTGADVARAVPHALAAADRARRLLALEDAVPVLEATRAALDMVGGEKRAIADVLVALGGARIELGDGEAGRAECREAIAIAREIGDADVGARAALAFASQFTFGLVLPENVSTLEQALAALPREDSAIRAKVQARLAAALQPALDVAPPIAMALDAIEMARRLGDPATLLAVLHTGLSALVDLGEPAVRRRLMEEMRELSTRLGERSAMQRAMLRLAFEAAEEFDLVGARARIEACLVLARETRHSAFEAQAGLALAMFENAAGRFEEGARLADEAARLAERAGDGNAVRTRRAQRLLCMMARNDLEAGRQAMWEFRETIATDWGALVGVCWAARSGVIEEGLGAFKQLWQGGERAPHSVVVAPANFSVAVEGAIATFPREELETAYGLLQTRLGRLITWGPTGMFLDTPIDRAAGLLADALGRPGDADLHFERAASLCREHGLAPALIRVLWDHATVLLGRSPPAVATARALLAEARSVAAGLALPAWVARIDAASAPGA